MVITPKYSMNKETQGSSQGIRTRRSNYNSNVTGSGGVSKVRPEENSDIETDDDDDSSQPRQPNVKVHEPSAYRNKSDNTKPTTSKNAIGTILTVVLAVLMIVIGWVIHSPPIEPKSLSLECLIKQFPHQSSETWESLNNSVRFTSESLQPMVITLAYNSTKTVKKFAAELSKFSVQSIFAKTVVHPIELYPSELNQDRYTKDFGYIVDDYKDKLNENKVMVVHDIQDLSGAVVTAFHSFCDMDEPIVKPSVFIFTFKVGDPQQYSTLKSIQNVLELKWKPAIKESNFQALVARMIDVIIKVVPEDD